MIATFHVHVHSFEISRTIPPPVYSVEKAPMRVRPKDIPDLRQRGGRRGDLVSAISVVEMHHETAQLVLQMLSLDLMIRYTCEISESASAQRALMIRAKWVL